METLYFTHNGNMIAYSETGSGPLVICAPSLGDLRQEYRFLLPALAEAGFRTAAMDLRGHGESSTGWEDYSLVGTGKDILALIRHLGGGPALVVGTSMSAGAAVWSAVEDPGAVAGLVLIGAAVRSTMPAWQARLLFTPLFAGPWGPAVWGRYYASLYKSARPADLDDYLARLQANFKEPGRKRALLESMIATKEASEERLERVQQPALVIMGTHDPDFKDPAAEAAFIGRSLRARVEMIAGAGHYPHAEVPQVTVPLIVDFAHQVLEGAYVA